MSTSAPAHAETTGIRPVEGADRSARARGGEPKPIPLPTLVDRQPSHYRPRALPTRFVAAAITAAIHLLILAGMLYEWHKPQTVSPPDDAITVTLLPLSPNRPAHKRDHGVEVRKQLPKPVSAAIPPPTVEFPQPAIVATPELVIQPPAPDDGGKLDKVAQATQAYQRAVLARLNTGRSYPRGALLSGYQGIGAIVFRIDRQGRLLDSSVTTSTGRKALDRAAMALVTRAAPFPAIPIELPDELAITMPIEFLIVEPSVKVAAR